MMSPTVERLEFRFPVTRGDGRQGEIKVFGVYVQKDDQNDRREVFGRYRFELNPENTDLEVMEHSGEIYWRTEAGEEIRAIKTGNSGA
jgi:hypothetical protein